LSNVYTVDRAKGYHLSQHVIIKIPSLLFSVTWWSSVLLLYDHAGIWSCSRVREKFRFFRV